MSKLIFRNALVNVAPSHYLFETFQKAGYTNVKYIPNTIEIENYWNAKFSKVIHTTSSNTLRMLKSP